MKLKSHLLLLALVISILVSSQVPQAFKYQAVARDNSGNVIVNQNIGFRISILIGSPTGSVVYAETHTVASNDIGLVNLDIGTGTLVSGNFSNINWGASTYFTKIEMDATGGSNYLFMGTSQLLSVPYALHAETANNVLNGSSYSAGTGISINNNTISNSAPDQTVSLTGTGGTSVTGVYPNFVINSATGGTNYTAGNGISINGSTIANTSPDQTVSITGTGGLSVTGTYPNFTINSTGGGVTLDQAYDFGGPGLGRTITVDNGAVQLNVNTANGSGLRADLSNTGVGIISNSNASGNTFSAIQATTNSSSNVASAITGSSSGAAWGVAGQVTNTATAEAGIYGSNLRTTGGHGVLGIGFNGTVGKTSYSTGMAVYGENADAIAPLGNGIGVGGSGYYGVVGEDMYAGSVTGAYGVLSSGNLGATGTKTFLIDHPTDPDNKILRHFSIESNEVLNVYRGTTAFDANGEAVIQLPDYFDAINKNPSYQLTPIGAPAQLYIKKKIQNNNFVVAGGQPGMEVSWIVTAERNDAYLQKYPEQKNTVILKRENQRGKYFMPELFGLPKEKSIFFNEKSHNLPSTLNILENR